MNRRLVAVCKAAVGMLTVMILTIWTGMVPVRAEAATTFRLNASVGINGYYDHNHLVPVVIRIANAGSRKHGYLDITLVPSASTSVAPNGNLHYPVTLAAGSVTKRMIVVPGSAVAQGQPIRLVINGNVVASTTLTGNSLGQVALVAVISNSLQGTQFLAGSSDPLNQEPVLAERIAPADVPTSADWFDGTTAITIEPQVLQELTSAQRDAIQSWVRLGGLLIVTGPTGKLSGWNSLLPLVKRSAHTVAAQSLLDFAGTYQGIPKNQITSYAASLAKTSTADLWAGNVQNPIVVGKSMGRGTIVQTAFSPLSPNLLRWNGDAGLWSTIIQRGLQSSDNSLPALTGTGGALSLTSSSDALSPMRVPPLRFWGPLFAAYVILIGPLLFFLLRRYRREPMAWWLLPVISLFTTGGIYGFGAVQRPHGVLSETVGMMELTKDGPAEVYGVTGFTSPYVTNAHFTTNGATFALPLAPLQARASGLATGQIGSNSNAHFEGVGRWNLRYLYTQGTVKGQGTLQAVITDTPGDVTGTVKNNTHLELHDAAVLWNGKLFEMGDLKAGQIETITSKTKFRIIRGNWLSEYGQYNGDITHGLGRALGSFIASTPSAGNLPQGRVMVVATTSLDKGSVAGLPEIFTAQKVISNEKMVFVRQFGQVVQPPAEDTVPAGVKPHQLTNSLS